MIIFCLGVSVGRFCVFCNMNSVGLFLNCGNVVGLLVIILVMLSG